MKRRPDPLMWHEEMRILERWSDMRRRVWRKVGGWVLLILMALAIPCMFMAAIKEHPHVASHGSSDRHAPALQRDR